MEEEEGREGGRLRKGGWRRERGRERGKEGQRERGREGRRERKGSKWKQNSVLQTVTIPIPPVTFFSFSSKPHIHVPVQG